MLEFQAYNKLQKYTEAVRECSRTMNLPEHKHDVKLRILTLLERAEALQVRILYRVVLVFSDLVHAITLSWRSAYFFQDGPNS